jgi:hypothetical protein
VIPTAALRKSLQQSAVDHDCAAYRQGMTDTVEGLIWLLNQRLEQPLSPGAKSELARLRIVLTERAEA